MDDARRPMTAQRLVRGAWRQLGLIMSLELAPTTLPLEDFLADRDTGLHLVERLTQELVDRRRILVWGPRVGAIELAEDLFSLWPTSATSGSQIVAVNVGALWTRTRADEQDSGWVPWVDVSPLQLMEQVFSRTPEGIVMTYASALVQEALPRLLEGPFGFVTAISASSATEALERIAPMFGDSFKRFDLLVGVAESGSATYITEVSRLVDGKLAPQTQLSRGHYVKA
jgi:hypothetical protein